MYLIKYNPNLLYIVNNTTDLSGGTNVNKSKSKSKSKRFRTISKHKTIKIKSNIKFGV